MNGKWTVARFFNGSLSYVGHETDAAWSSIYRAENRRAQSLGCVEVEGGPTWGSEDHTFAFLDNTTNRHDVVITAGHVNDVHALYVLAGIDHN